MIELSPEITTFLEENAETLHIWLSEREKEQVELIRKLEEGEPTGITLTYQQFLKRVENE
ncbi:MAG: hypothetical protein ABW148_06125 [Sedimenticola sp.]